MKAISSNKYQVPLPCKDIKKLNGSSQLQVQTQRLVDVKKMENQNTKRVKIGSTILVEEKSKNKLKKARSPQIIKLMIQELQKELQQKIKPLAKDRINQNCNSSNKSLKSTANSDVIKGNKKAKLQNTDGQISMSKLCANKLKSPNKPKKLNKNITKQNSSQILSPRNMTNSVKNLINRPLTAKKLQKKKRTKINLNLSSNYNIQNQKYKMPQRKAQRQNFLVLGDQFLQLKNISALTQFQFSDNEEITNLSQNRKKKYQNTHQRWSSDFEYLPKQIQRSFFQEQKSTAHEIIKEDFDQFVHLIHNQSDQHQSPFEEESSQQDKQVLTIFKVIKIQRWWRQVMIQRKIELGSRKQKVLQDDLLISDQSIKNYQIDNEQAVSQRYKVFSKSEKNIENQQHEDILKLRQNAANLQFKTHQQILIQLFQNNKINQKDFEQKNELIQRNFEKELTEIQSIKNILKESAKKVEDIMKKTREDIKIIQNISSTNNTKESRGQSSTQSQYFLAALFGEPVRKTSSHSSQRSGNNSQHCKKQKSKYQKVKINFDNQIQQFLQEDQNFGRTNGSGGIFNTPDKELSRQKIESQQQEGERVTFDEDDEMQNQIYSGRINETQNMHTALSPLQNPNLQQLYKEFQVQQEIKKQLQLRIAKQMGITPESIQMQQGKIGINTSIIGIHKFLLNFFKFYLYYHKTDFVNLINSPYGQSVQTRLKKNREQQTRMELLNQWQQEIVYTQEEQQIIYGLKAVIPKEVIQQFFQSYYEQTDIQFTDVQKTNIQLQKIHNRAVFDSFNQNLNDFRPYFCIKGPPYIWTNSQKALTYYIIGEQNIQEVYQKTQMKLLKQASFLCGLSISKEHKKLVFCSQQKNQPLKVQFQQINSPFKLLQNESCQFSGKNSICFQQYLYTYTTNFQSAYFSNLQERLSKKQSIQTQEQNKQWFDNRYEQQKVNTLLDVSAFVQQMILNECVSQMLRRGQLILV